MATSSTQSQGGSDVAISTRKPSTTVSKRVQPKQVTTVTSGGPPKTATMVTAAQTTRSVEVAKVGFALSFSIQINNSLPPKLLP